ncbi:MAG: hypothetical protein EP338_03355 [Bacteroidetes bacterium]|nr:MAG: hypothetical protein EP338_03355 [Bacteroidota bacterium]
MKSNFFYSIAILEGAALMATEVISAKIMAPYYGSSLLVWTSVFVATLGGLATGYFLGGKLASGKQVHFKLFVLLLSGSVYLGLMPFISTGIMEATLNMSVELGSLISVMTFLFPILLAFGTVSPLLIQLLTGADQKAGESAGIIYTISTLGGIVSTVLFGFYLIPQMGIKSAVMISCAMSLLATVFAFYAYQKNKSTSLTNA